MNVDQQMNRPCILVVEDSPVLRHVAVFQLSHYDVDVEHASNGTEAVDRFLQRRYSLILMDVMMPEMDGLEATRIMREHEAELGRRTPIIAITASDTRENCLEAGMDDYVTKPADYQRVLKRWLPECCDGQST